MRWLDKIRDKTKLTMAEWQKQQWHDWVENIQCGCCTTRWDITKIATSTKKYL